MIGPDYIVDIDGLPRAVGGPGGAGRNSLRGRPWLAIQWRCCEVYCRVYRNRQRDAYEGRCPKCNRPVKVRIGPDGTHARFFEAI